MPLRDTLFGRKASDGAVPTEAKCSEARLDIKTSGDKLDFLCSQPAMRFFSLRAASLAGVFSVSRSVSEDKIPTTRLMVPLQVDGRSLGLQIIFCGDEADQSYTLRQSSMVAQPDGTRSLQFNFGEGKKQSLYTFSVPADVEIQDFQLVEPKKAAPSGPPSAAQLAAVLRATLQQRRDTISTMEDLAVPLSVDTLKIVGLMREKLGPRFTFQTPPLQWLHEFMQSQELERTLNPSTLAAIALLLDMEGGLLSADDVERLALGTLNLRTSWEALTHVAYFLGTWLDPDEWAEKFQAAALPFSNEQDRAVAQKMAAALALIEERMSKRDTRAVLINLVRESPSPRVDEIVRLWRRSLKTVSKGRVDGFDSYCEYLGKLGCRMDPNTLLALCLYAETEAGRVSGPQFEKWLEGQGTLTLSAYAMQAVAWALDLELVALTTGSSGKVSGSLYKGLFTLCPFGMLQGLSNVGQDVTTYRIIDQFTDLEGTMPVGWRASGDVLLKVGCLERISAEEADLFLNLGNSFFASFQSDLDRRHVWKKMIPGQNREANFSFVEGFRVYHFQSRVMAEIMADQEVLCGGTSPGIYKDHRGSLHYFHPLDGAPPTEPMEKVPLRLSFPAVDDLPSTLQEMDQEKMLGRVEAKATSEYNKLDLIDQALRTLLGRKADEGPALTAKGLQSIVRNLESPRLMQRLRQVMDIRTLEAFKKEFLQADFPALEYRIYEPILKGLKHVEVLDFVCLALVYELCTSDLTTAKTILKVFDKHWFRAALRNQLLVIMESPNPEVRQMGCRLLATDASLEESSERPIVEYELTKHLESEDPGCVQEAANSLARLVLEKVLPLPHLWNCSRIEAGTSDDSGQLGEERLKPQFLAAIREIREWQSRTTGMLAGESRDEPTVAVPKAKGGLRDLAWLTVGARDAIWEEQKRTRGRKSSVLLLASEHGLVQFLKKFIGSWQAYAEHSHSSLPEVVAEVLADKTVPRYLDFVKQSDEFSHLWWPLDAGMEEYIPHWLLRDISTPEPLWILRNVAGHVTINPFFSGLVHKAVESTADKIRVCRLASVTEARRTHPSAFKLEVFNSRSGRFSSFLEEMRIPGQFFLTVREQDLLNVLASLALHVEPSEMDVVPSATEPASSLPAYKYKAQRRDEDGDTDSGAMMALARGLLEIFQLPGSYLTQVMYILKEVRSYSIYKLW